MIILFYFFIFILFFRFSVPQSFFPYVDNDVYDSLVQNFSSLVTPLPCLHLYVECGSESLSIIAIIKGSCISACMLLKRNCNHCNKRSSDKLSSSISHHFLRHANMRMHECMYAQQQKLKKRDYTFFILILIEKLYRIRKIVDGWCAQCMQFQVPSYGHAWNE